MSTRRGNPTRRVSGLIVRTHQGPGSLPEISVFDTKVQLGYSLRSATALVWQCADGQHSIQDIVDVVERDLGLDDASEVVDSALEELSRAGLLTGLRSRARVITRRLVLQGMAAAAAALSVLSSSRLLHAGIGDGGTNSGSGY